MTAVEIYEKVKAKFGDAISELQEGLDPWVTVTDTGKLPELAEFLRTDSDLDMHYLMCLSGADDGTNLSVVYHCCSLVKKHRFTFKVEGLQRENPHVPSVEHVWPTANWHEREAYDMFGIFFDNHPDLRRILCPDDWEGYPLRKDYQVQAFWHGIPVPYPDGLDPDRGHHEIQKIPDKPYAPTPRPDEIDMTST